MHPPTREPGRMTWYEPRLTRVWDALAAAHGGQVPRGQEPDDALSEGRLQCRDRPLPYGVRPRLFQAAAAGAAGQRGARPLTACAAGLIRSRMRILVSMALVMSSTITRRRYAVQDGGRAEYPAELQTTPSGWRLRFGAVPCVIFDVYYPHDEIDEQDRVQVLEELATAHLMGVSYSDRCTTSGDMERGKGTVAMLKTAMKFLKVLFPAVTGATFKDTSHVDCAQNTSVSLKHLSLARYSKTWYMRYFDAEPGSNMKEQVMADLQLGQRAMVTSLMMSYDNFYELEIYDSNDRPKVKQFKESMRKYYDGYYDTETNTHVPKAASCREFVERLTDIDCVMIETWLARFVDKKFGSASSDNFNWRMNVQSPEVHGESLFAAKEITTATSAAAAAVDLVGGGYLNMLVKDRKGKKLVEAIHLKR